MAGLRFGEWEGPHSADIGDVIVKHDEETNRTSTVSITMSEMDHLSRQRSNLLSVSLGHALHICVFIYGCLYCVYKKGVCR